MKFSRTLLATLAASVTLPAAAGELTMTTGLDYSSGKYGTNTTSETWYVPIAAKYVTDRLTLKMTVPYLRTTNAVVDDSGNPVASSNCGSTESGLGDITASAGYAVLDGSKGGLILDLVGKVKMPTAESSCLGNNKTDYGVQVDLAKAFGSVTGFGTLGWKDMGNSDFNDPVFASVGLATRVGDATTVGVAYDWREKLTSRGDAISEASLFLSQKLSAQWKLQVYAVKGYTDNSPDYGGGVMVSHTY